MALRQAGLSFWIAPGDAPRCLLEQLAVSILRAHLEPIGLANLECACGEWWVQHRRGDESIQLHFDADETLKSFEIEVIQDENWASTLQMHCFD